MLSNHAPPRPRSAHTPMMSIDAGGSRLIPVCATVLLRAVMRRDATASSSLRPFRRAHSRSFSTSRSLACGKAELQRSQYASEFPERDAAAELHHCTTRAVDSANVSSYIGGTGSRPGLATDGRHFPCMPLRAPEWLRSAAATQAGMLTHTAGLTFSLRSTGICARSGQANNVHRVSEETPPRCTPEAASA